MDGHSESKVGVQSEVYQQKCLCYKLGGAGSDSVTGLSGVTLVRAAASPDTRMRTVVSRFVVTLQKVTWC